MRLELLPKTLDTLDSAVFALRTRLIGGLGVGLKNTLAGSALLGGLVVTPYGPAVALAAVGTYCSVELLYRAVSAVGFGRPQPARR